MLSLLLGLFPALLFILPSRIKSLESVLDKLEWASYDMRMSIRPRKDLDKRIILIGVTDIDYYLNGEMINSREAYALAFQALRKLGVHSVLVDILLEHTRDYDSLITLNMQMLPTFLAYKFLTNFSTREIEQEYGLSEEKLSQEMAQLMDGEQTRERIQDLLDEREMLKEQRREFHNNAEFEQEKNADRQIKQIELLAARIAERYLEFSYKISHIEEPGLEHSEANPFRAMEVIFPSPQVMINAAGLGYINIEKGDEEVVRRVPLVFSHNKALYPHIDLVYLCHYYGVDPRNIRVKFGEHIEFTPTKNAFSPKRIPIDNRGNYLINFRQGEQFLGERGLALHHLLHYEVHGASKNSRIEPALFKNAFILLGENNVGGSDTQPIPLQPGFPMVGIHANVLDNILNDDYIRLLSPSVLSLIIILCGLLLGIMFINIEYRKATIITAVILGYYILVAIIAFNKWNLVIPVVKPLGTIMLGYLLLIFYTVVIAEKEQRQVRGVFFKTVSPEIGEEILRQYNNEAIWGSKQRVTIMFADIRGFTTLSETLSPESTVELVNLFYDLVSKIILAHRGQVNKFIGDEVMALFGAPLQRDDTEIDAILTAVEIQKQVQRLNDEQINARFGSSIAVGIGINTGEVVVGTVGGKQTRIEYTALGDNVNIAARLQKMAQAHQIFIGAETYQRVVEDSQHILTERNISFNQLSGVALKGKVVTIDVYEVAYERYKPASAAAESLRP